MGVITDIISFYSKSARIVAAQSVGAFNSTHGLFERLPASALDGIA